MIAKLASQKRDMEVVGHGALRNAGRAAKSDVVLSTSGLKGVTLYEPTEIVMSARAGTPVYEIEAILAARGQMLAFEPVDLGPATGAPDGALSIGGVFATNFSGSRRIAAGSARDNLLGVRAVNGRGEIFKSGGRVMKNVTGLDVARGLTGSWGTLAVMTEVTFKVAPLPHTMVTLAYTGLPDDLGIEALTVAMGTPLEVSGAVHLPKNCASRLKQAKLKGLDEPVTLLRLENFSAAVDERKDKLKAALKVYGNPIELDAEQTWNLWSEFRALSVMPFSNETSLWRISALPTKAAEIVSAIQKFMDVVAFYDWAGALIWFEVPVTADAGAADVRRAVSVRGGHATLIRATARSQSQRRRFRAAEAGNRAIDTRHQVRVRSGRTFEPRPYVRQHLDVSVLRHATRTVRRDANQLFQCAAPRYANRGGGPHSAPLRSLRALHGDVPDLRRPRR